MAFKSIDKQVNVGIPLRKSQFEYSGGLFPSVYAGKITAIADLFHNKHKEMSQTEILTLINQRDQGGRTPGDIAW